LTILYVSQYKTHLLVCFSFSHHISQGLMDGSALFHPCSDLITKIGPNFVFMNYTVQIAVEVMRGHSHCCMPCLWLTLTWNWKLHGRSSQPCSWRPMLLTILPSRY